MQPDVETEAVLEGAEDVCEAVLEGVEDVCEAVAQVTAVGKPVAAAILQKFNASRAALA